MHPFPSHSTLCVAEDALNAVSIGGPASELPSMPGLEVDGNAVPLPVGLEEGAVLYALAAPSPHGVGTQTSYDTSVRKSRELVKGRFRMLPSEVCVWVCLSVCVC